VATPLGNLADISYRAVEVLSGVHTIAAENVSHTRVLCARYNIRTKVLGYRRENQKARTPQMLGLLTSGNDIALVSDAGTPGISDPGGYLVDAAARAQIDVRPVPGPCAVAGALSVSGLPAEQFVFLGFLPNKAGRRRALLESLIREKRTVVFFEAPHRLNPMLSDLKEILGDRRVVVAREMTKIFEEFIRGTVSSVQERLSKEVKGEITVVMEGAGPVSSFPNPGFELPCGIDQSLMQGEISMREAAERLSSESGMTYRHAYKICLERKKLLEKSVGDGD
jgi:16S rRNA (cytidine1402-2'-O)-methyltransferase